MNKTLEEIAATSTSSPLWKSKVDYLNATEKLLARIEGRTPIVYEFRPPNPPRNLTVH